MSCLLAALLALSACARPTGDFGRADPSFTHDRALPAVGGFVARHGREDLVSDFGQTDREGTLRDRAWAIVMPPHARDWLGAILVEGQRTRILPEIDAHYDVGAYHRLLRRDEFRSSEARWSRLVEDMRKDAALAGPFWGEARAVRRDDEARVRAMDGRTDLGPYELRAIYARIDENARVVDWVWRAMRFRLAAYRAAIDRLAVETPTDRLDVVNGAWFALRTAIAAAERGPQPVAIAPVPLPQPSRYGIPVAPGGAAPAAEPGEPLVSK